MSLAHFPEWSVPLWFDFSIPFSMLQLHGSEFFLVVESNHIRTTKFVICDKNIQRFLILLNWVTNVLSEMKNLTLNMVIAI